MPTASGCGFFLSLAANATGAPAVAAVPAATSPLSTERRVMDMSLPLRFRFPGFPFLLLRLRPEFPRVHHAGPEKRAPHQPRHPDGRDAHPAVICGDRRIGV